MSVSQAAIGLLALQGLEILGVEPSELEEVVALYRQLSPEGMETATFVRAAMTLKQVSEKTGKDPEELEVWVEGSEARARELERQCRDLTPMAEEVEGLKQHRDSMTREMAALNSRKEVLKNPGSGSFASQHHSAKHEFVWSAEEDATSAIVSEASELLGAEAKSVRRPPGSPPGLDRHVRVPGSGPRPDHPRL